MLVGMPFLRVFDRMGYGGLVLSTHGHVLALNDSARRIFQAMFCLSRSEVEVDVLDGLGRGIVKRLLNQGRARFQLDSENWILVERPDQRPLIMNAVPLPIDEVDGSHSVLLLIDLDATPILNHGALEQVFGLTRTEAKLATLMAQGATLAEAAALQGVRVATVRAQLRAIFAKTHTHRQAELVMLVSRLSSLP
ncbi:MAG: helix-turn-helix transcriptional regulator [Alphaproteobacteria bacterium]|jgi:DNA-binding CsgD family transcriptional regulator|nr:helix-turn-helix transcriptional regulator [Methylobacterium sp. V23]RYY05477.1 MAG: helix-turn-helix transcriptional regulator [Alphaproteobacteria bacterium]